MLLAWKFIENRLRQQCFPASFVKFPKQFFYKIPINKYLFKHLSKIRWNLLLSMKSYMILEKKQLINLSDDC